MKDTVTYPLSAIMDEDEESRIDQLERELAAAIASFSEERERAQREGARVIKLQGELAEAVAKERERCALVCEGRAGHNSMGAYQILMSAADAIRKGE